MIKQIAFGLVIFLCIPIPVYAAQTGKAVSSNLSTWVAYRAIEQGLTLVSNDIKGNNSRDKCSIYTFITPSQRLADEALINQVKQLLIRSCNAEKDLGIPIGKECTGTIKTETGRLIPFSSKVGIATLSSLATAATGALTFLTSLEPTYTITTSSAPIAQIDAQRELMRLIGANKIYGLSISASYNSDIVTYLSNIKSAKKTIDKARTPKNNFGVYKSKQAWEAAKKSDSSSLQSFLSKVNDPAKNALYDLLKAEGTENIPSKACTITLDIRGSASSMIHEKTIFSNNNYYEAGTSVISYDVQHPNGSYETAGIVTTTCELGHTYSFGNGSPPDPKQVVCNSTMNPPKNDRNHVINMFRK